MKTLWAPWRMSYIEREEKAAEGCVFCNMIAADHDLENLIVYRGPLAVVFLNRYPYNNGHTLVMPLSHIGEMDDLDRDQLYEVFDTVRLARRALDRVMAPQGYNIGINLGRAAGAGIPDHFHVHIVPRWDGDTNFMPVLADIGVIPEHLTSTGEKLARAFSELTRTKKQK